MTWPIYYCEEHDFIMEGASAAGRHNQAPHKNSTSDYSKTFLYVGVGGNYYEELAWWDNSQRVDIVNADRNMHHPSAKERELIDKARKEHRQYSRLRGN